MTFWRPPKNTQKGDFVSEFGSHSKFGKKLDNSHDTQRLKTVSSWQSGENNSLGSKPQVQIKKCPEVMSTVAEKCKRRSYESRLRKSNKENDFNYNVSKPFKNQDKNALSLLGVEFF